MKVILSKATEDDWDIMLKWRNDPEVMRGFYSQKTGRSITRDEHTAWLKSRNQDCNIFLVCYGDEGGYLQRIGIIVLSQLDYWEPEIGIYIGEKSFWGKGIAKTALKQVLYLLKSNGYQYTRVSILDNNVRSINLFQRLGFVRIGDARPGESLFRLEL